MEVPVNLDLILLSLPFNKKSIRYRMEENRFFLDKCVCVDTQIYGKNSEAEAQVAFGQQRCFEATLTTF